MSHFRRRILYHFSTAPITSLLLALFAFVLSAGSLKAAPLRVLVMGASSAASTADALANALQSCGASAERSDSLSKTEALDKSDVIVLLGAKLTEPDRAVLDAFTKRGGGIVALGDTIAAGAWMRPLVGATWTANTQKFTSQMMFHPLTDAHPITRDASAFDITDETFYDLDLDPAVDVLASAFTPKVTGKKKDARAPEKLDRANVYDIQPQMWIYEGADKHRALVLLQSSAATLEHASIRTFILRGIAWAAKHENIDSLVNQDDLATLRYPAGGPRRAADTAKSFEIAPGFQASAIASEPLINKPIAMQWDARGRLWIAETPEYPNGRRPLTEAAWKETGVLKPEHYDRPATDRISILEDTDGDGVMDNKTVYFEGLELVTGFCLWRDGFIAVHQPDIVFVHGEGAEKKIERLYTGFSPGDTHFVANHFMVSPDGWIYANTGSSADAVSVVAPTVKTKVSPGIFRFKPDGSAIQQVGSKGGNGFGMDITSDGEWFFGQATSGNPVQHVVLPEWVLAKGKVGKAGSAENVIAGRKVVRPDMPTRVPYMQIDVVGGYSAACASTVQEGGAWPAQWNDTVFCTEPILDIIHFEKLKYGAPNIVGEMTEPNREWLRAEDWWFFPIDVQFGPDGAMYVLDLYNPIVAHSDSRGPKHSRAGASVRPDREHYFGRIYRIQHSEARKLQALDLAKADAIGLVKAFLHPNKHVRFTAHRLLMDSEDAPKAVGALSAMAAAEKFIPARILALWALVRLGKLDAPTLKTALGSEDIGVRKSALLIAETLGAKNQVDVTAPLQDTDVRVRLLALRALGAVPLDPAGASALLAVLPKLEDDWSRSAAVAAAALNAGPVLEAALAASGAPSESALDLAGSLAASFAESQDGVALGRVIAAAAKASPEAAPLVLTVLQNAAARLPAAPAQVPDEAIRKLLASADVSISASALPYAVAWDRTGPSIAPRIASLLLVIADARQPDAVRSTAITGLIRARIADARIVPAVLDVLKSKPADALLLDVIAALASTADAALGQPLVAVLPNLSPLGQTALFDALVTRAAWAHSVLDAMAAKQLPPALLGPAKLSKLRLHPDTTVAKRAIQIFTEIGAGSNPAKDELIAKLQPAIEGRAGNATQGKALFAGACALCHKLNGEGNDIGPVLDGIGVHGTHELLVHILDPNRVVDNEHRTWNLAMKNGQFATGIIARENESTVTLKLPGGAQQDIRVAEIKSRQDTGLSLMPEGFEGLGPDGLRDLLAYLSGGSSKYRAVPLGTSFTTDTTGGLYASREAKNDTVQPVRYGVVTVEGVPFSLPDPSTTANGGNVIVLKPGDGGTYAATLPQRVEIPVGFAAGNIHFLSGVAGWGGSPDTHKPAMKVTMQFADGKQQVEELYTGDVFIDYPSSEEVPGSKRAEGIVKRTHIRYFSLPVNERAPIKTLVLESYKNGVAPTTLSITADNEAPKPKVRFAPPAIEGLPKTGETLPAKAEPGIVRVLLVGGGSSHDFERFFRQADGAILKATGRIVTAYTSHFDEAIALFAHADAIVLSANHPSFGSAPFQKALNAFADAGKGVVVLHAGTWYNWPTISGYNKRFVGGGSRGHGFGDFQVFLKEPAHPVLIGLPAEFTIHDEHYHIELMPDADVEVLALTSTEPKTKKAYPAVWLVKDAKARIIGISLGHAKEAHSNPAYQKLLINAVRWVAGQE